MEGVRILFSSDIKHEPEDAITEKVEETLEVKILSNGIKYEPGNVPPWKLPRSCDKCGKEFRSKGHLQRHAEGVHHKFKGYIYVTDVTMKPQTGGTWKGTKRLFTKTKDQRLPAIFVLIKRGLCPP